MKKLTNGLGRKALTEVLLNVVKEEYGYADLDGVVIAGVNKAYSYGYVGQAGLNSKEHTLAPRKVKRLIESLDEGKFYIVGDTLVVQDAGTKVLDIDGDKWMYIMANGSGLVPESLTWLSPENTSKYIALKGDLEAVYEN